MWLYEDNCQRIFPLQKCLFFSLLMTRPLGSLKPKYVSISKCFLLHHTGFLQQVLPGESGRCMRAILLKQGLPLSGRFSITPAKGSWNTSVSLVWHQAIALYRSMGVMTEDIRVSYGHTRKCRAVDTCVVKDWLVWVYGVFIIMGHYEVLCLYLFTIRPMLRSQLVSYKKITQW